MKKLLTVAVATFAILAVTGCEDPNERSRQYHEQKTARFDRLYKECVDAGGSFHLEDDGWGSEEYGCTLPNTSVPSKGSVDIEVNN